MDVQPLVPNKGEFDDLKEIFNECAVGESPVNDFDSFLYGWFFAKSGRSAEVTEASVNAFEATLTAWEDEIYGTDTEEEDEN